VDLKAQDAPVGSSAFTIDVSAGGFCAELMRVPSPGAEVKGSMAIGGQEFPFSGRIAWVRAGEPRLNLRGRIGVTFTEVADDLRKKLI
jgi:hypothetical protein